MEISLAKARRAWCEKTVVSVESQQEIKLQTKGQKSKGMEGSVEMVLFVVGHNCALAR